MTLPKLIVFYFLQKNIFGKFQKFYISLYYEKNDKRGDFLQTL